MKNTTGAVILILSYVVYGVAARNPPNDNVGLCSCHEAACVPLSQCPRLQSLARSRDIENMICQKTGASKKYCCLPSNVCSKLDHRISENQVSTVGNDAKTVAANALPITEETNVWVKTTEENDGVFAVENYSDADTTKLNAGAFSTEPNVRAYSTEPNVRAYSTEPNVRAHSPEPNVRAYSTEPNVRAFSKEPNARGYSMEPNARAFSTEPNARGYSMEPNDLAFSTEPNASLQLNFSNIPASDEAQSSGENSAWHGSYPTLVNELSGSKLNASLDSQPSIDERRIVGGRFDPSTKNPWLVSIYSYDYSAGAYYQCAGGLITSRFVLTCAHCFHDNFGLERTLYQIELGRPDKTTQFPSIVIRAQDLSIVEYPAFQLKPRIEHDIALVVMRNPVSTNVPNIKALRLLPDSFTTWSLTNQVGRVAGWGSTGTVVSSEILYQTTMTIDNRFCQGLSVFNPDSQLCLMGVSGSDICSGDSGTPLSLDAGGFRYLVGVISRNLDCSGRNPTFAGFVSYYYKWIVDTIAEYGGSNDVQYGV